MDLFGDSDSDSDLPAPPSSSTTTSGTAAPAHQTEETLVVTILSLRSVFNRKHPRCPFHVRIHEEVDEAAKSDLGAALANKGLALSKERVVDVLIVSPSDFSDPSSVDGVAHGGSIINASSGAATPAVHRAVIPNTTSCLWKTPSLAEEKEMLAQITLQRPASAHAASGLEAGSLPPSCVTAAVEILKAHGVCVIPDFLGPDVVAKLTAKALSDFDAAYRQLNDKFGVDVRNPTDAAMTYHEVAAREDFRVDLRNGPAMKSFYATPDHEQLCNIPGIKDIVSQVFMPRCPTDATLHMGNYGLYNFGGSGPEVTPAPSVGRFGSVISLPGAGDQAIHADTPHLFHDVQCPAHYINFFIPGVQADDSVGWTAFVPRSHNLDVCRDVMADGVEGKKLLHRNIVRPRHNIGDVLLFDCRVLHFGTGNTSSGVDRPLHYVNYFKEGFRDTKNWDDRERIFGTPKADN
jgi:hypothetical protein